MTSITLRPGCLVAGYFFYDLAVKVSETEQFWPAILYSAFGIASGLFVLSITWGKRA